MDLKTPIIAISMAYFMMLSTTSGQPAPSNRRNNQPPPINPRLLAAAAAAGQGVPNRPAGPGNINAGNPNSGLRGPGNPNGPRGPGNGPRGPGNPNGAIGPGNPNGPRGPGNPNGAMGPNGQRSPNGQRLPTGTGRSNPNTGNNSPNSCSATGRAAISQCFDVNGGINMQQVVGLLSNGTQMPTPRNPDKVRSDICAKEGTIISCVFTSINGLRSSPRCPSMQEYVRLEQETIGLITGMQRICGKGPLPAPSACLRNLNRDLKQCYSEVGLNHDIFAAAGGQTSGKTGSEIIGAVIGDNPKAATKFCRVKSRLFECMKATLDKCPGSVEVMALSGYDHESLQKGIDVLCHDVRVYVDGLRCFQNPRPEVTQCYNTMVQKVAELTKEQIQRSLPLYQFYTQFCQLKIQHMACDIGAWRNQCQNKTVGLKNEFECNLLPTRCKNNPILQDRLQQTCAIPKFERHLRSGAERSLSVSGIVITVLSLALAFVL